MSIVFVAVRINQIRYFSNMVSFLQRQGLDAMLAVVATGRGSKGNLGWTQLRVAEAKRLLPTVPILLISSEEDKSRFRQRITNKTVLVSVGDLSYLFADADLSRCTWIMIQHSDDHLHHVAISREKPNGFALWGSIWQSDYLVHHPQINPIIASAQMEVLSRPSAVLGHLGIGKVTHQTVLEKSLAVKKAEFFEPSLVGTGGNSFFDIVRGLRYAVGNVRDLLNLRSLIGEILEQLERTGANVCVRRRGKMIHFPLGYGHLDSYVPLSIEDQDPSAHMLLSDLVITDRNSTAMIESLVMGIKTLAFDRGVKMYERRWRKLVRWSNENGTISRSPLWIMNERLIGRRIAGLELVSFREHVEPALHRLNKIPTVDGRVGAQGWIDFPKKPEEGFLELIDVSTRHFRRK